MVAVEDALRTFERRGFDGGAAPRHVADGLEPRADDRVFGAVGVDAPQAIDLAHRLLGDGRRHPGLRDPALELVRLGFRPGGLPELRPNGLELLPQVVLALPVVHRALHERVHVRRDPLACELHGEVVERRAHADLEIGLLEVRDLLGERHVRRGCDLVGEALGVVRSDGERRVLLDLEARGLGELLEPGHELEGERARGPAVFGRAERCHGDRRGAVALADRPGEPHPAAPFEQHPHASVGQPGHPQDLAQDPDRRQARVERILFVGIELGDEHEGGSALDVVEDGLHRGRAADREDPEHPRVHDHPPQRQGDGVDGHQVFLHGQPRSGGRHVAGAGRSSAISRGNGSKLTGCNWDRCCASRT